MRRILAGVAVLAAAAPAAAQHGPIEIGRYITNRVVFHLHEPLPMEMLPSSLPQPPGYAMDDLAIESLQVMNEHEHFPLAAGSDIRLRLVSIDPGLTLYNGASPMTPGQEIVLGSPFFSVVPLWTIAPGPAGGVYSATLRARDAAGISGESDPFVISFVTVPGPGTGVIVAFGAGMLARRRRGAAR